MYVRGKSGCKVAFLSLFTYRHVYGVECSAISNQAKEIIRENGLEVPVCYSNHAGRGHHHPRESRGGGASSGQGGHHHL